MKTFTVPQLLGFLAGHPVKGAKQATILSLTMPPLLPFSRTTGERNPFVKGVQKLAYRPVTLGANYEACVNRERLKEENGEYFTAEKLWNGMGVYHTPYTVTHKKKGGVYFAVKPAQEKADTPQGSVAVCLEVQWRDIATGQFVKAEDVKGFLREPNKSQRQNVQHDVLWRTFDVKNVLEVHYAGSYTLKH